MKYRICISALLLWAGMQLSASNNQEEVVIKIIETSDVHGNFFPYNFIERKEWSGSLARMGHRTKRFFQWSGKMGERF